MLNLPGFKTVLLLASAALWLAPPTPLRADDRMTAGEFLARCDRFDADCRTEFVAGLQAVYEGKLACPPRIDVNTPITPWLDYMHRRVLENPGLADADNNRLQLEAFQYLWPCPEN
ncbi:MAG TPA: hypothetical protein VI732_04550 [Alphaproteobacteria bacterium]|nr:hypothetical protein [Alphaproteobacteria bacterium]